MERDIKMICEAFSMQPMAFRVGNLAGASETRIASIQWKLKAVEGVSREYYVGFDTDGNVLFEYPRVSVSVHYY